MIGMLSVAMLAGAAAVPTLANTMGSDTRTVIPYDVQQLVVVDYRSMQNSQVAMQLKSQIMPPDIKRFEDALKTSGMNENHADVRDFPR
jgi:hypothetical protein